MKPGNDKHRSLLEHLPDAFACCRLITDSEGKPVDCVFLEVNRAFAKMTGLKEEEVVGKPVTEIYPGIKNEDFDWISTCGQVALQGESAVFEYCFEPRDRWYAITVYSDAPGYVALICRDITDSKKTEKKYRLLSENISDVIWTTDMNLNYTYISPSGEHISGYSVEEIMSLGIEKILTPSSLERAFQVVREELELEASGDADPNRTRIVELEQYRKDGSTAWVEIKASPLRDSQGRPYGFLGITRDISDRKRAEEELRQFNTFLDSIIENIPSAVMIKDAEELKYIRINRAAEKLTGYSRTEVIGKTDYDFVPQEKADAFIGKDRQALEAKKMLVFPEETLVTSQRGLRIIHSRKTPILDRHNEPEYLLNITEDITEHRQAEIELQENRNLLISMFQSIQDGISILDTDLTIREVNHTMKKWHEYAAPLIGKKCYKVYQNRSKPCVPCPSIRALEEKTVCSEIVPLMGEDKQVGWVEVYAYPLLDKTTGSVNGVVEFVRDITERRQAEENMNNALTQLKASFEGTKDGITLCDMESNTFVDCNERALALFGFKSKPEFMQKHPSAYSPAYQPDGVKSEQRAREKIIEALKKNNSPTFEWVHQRNDGSTFFAEVTLTTYTLGNNTILQSNIRDISKRKLAEQKLADYTLELEQLYHHLDAELDKARQVHERTLPTALPTVEGISFAAHYQPAQKMGGDLYDVIHKDNKLIFYLSDVSGHGLDGAMLSFLIKEAIYSYINLKPDHISPHQIIKHLSRQFGRESYDEELFFCIFIAVLDLETLELSYCGAGFQEKMLLRLGNGDRLALAAAGMFITSYLPAEMLTLKDQSIVITPGSTIFLTTDGLTEQRAQGVYYRDRLPDVFYANAQLPPQLIVQAVLDNFRRFNNGSLQGNDDITFLVLQIDAT